MHTVCTDIKNGLKHRQERASAREVSCRAERTAKTCHRAVGGIGMEGRGWLEPTETSAQGATAPGQPLPKLHNKAGDNLMLGLRMHLPTAAQPLAARKGSGTEKTHWCSLALKRQKRTF